MASDLNLNQLKAFYYAASCGSITRAAEKLFITQPAVTLQIKALEDRHSVQLFIRRKKKLELTPSGKLLYQVAEKIFALVEDAERVLDEAHDFAEEVLRIGSSKQLVRHLLSRYISAFRTAFPRVRIQISEGSSEEMLANIRENRNDIAIVGRLPYQDNLEVIPFIEDALVVLTSPTHRLAEREGVSLEELAGENLILREKGSGTRQLVDGIFRERGISTRGSIETGNVDFIKEMVGAGNGITLLARMGVDHEVNKGELRAIPIKEGPFLLAVDIVYDRNKTLSQADKAFLDMLIKAKAGSQPVYTFHPFAADEETLIEARRG
jgi:DNA-binding transcriptional LysR family regulator